MKFFMITMLAGLIFATVQTKLYMDKLVKNMQGAKQISATTPAQQQRIPAGDYDADFKELLGTLPSYDLPLKELGLNKDLMKSSMVTQPQASEDTITKAVFASRIDALAQKFVRAQVLSIVYAKRIKQKTPILLGGFALLIIVLRLLKLRLLLKYCSGFFYIIAQAALFLTSISAVSVAIIFKMNLLSQVVWLPAGVVGLSILGLKLHEKKYPLVTKILYNLITPACAFALIYYIVKPR